MFAIKQTAGLYTEYVHSVRTQGDTVMTESEKIALEVAAKEAETKLIQSYVKDSLDKQKDMGIFGLSSDILNSYLRRTHNHALLKEAKSRVAMLKEAEIDLGTF